MDGGKTEKNFVHEDENWRQRVRYETESQKSFKENWGFLELGNSADPVQVKFNTRLVKYFNPHGGTWTVSEKRVPDSHKRSATENGEDDMAGALGAAARTHTLKMSSLSENVYMAAFNATSK